MYSSHCFLSLSEIYMLLCPHSSTLLILKPSLSHVGPAYASPVFFLAFLRSSSAAPCLLSRHFQPWANTAAPYSHRLPGKGFQVSSCLSLPLPHPHSSVSGSTRSIDTREECLFLTITFMNGIVVTAKPFFTGFPDSYSPLPSENCKSFLAHRACTTKGL